MSEYTNKNGIVYKNQFHIVWCTKYRRPLLKDKIRERLIVIINETANELNVDIKSIEVMPEHIHIFIEFDPRLLLHLVIKRLKGTSSRILRNEFPELKTKLPSLWTRSYFSCTVGHINEETIIKYIESQFKSYRDEKKSRS